MSLRTLFKVAISLGLSVLTMSPAVAETAPASTPESKVSPFLSASVGYSNPNLSGFDDATSFGITAGVQFSGHFALEAGYVDLGEADGPTDNTLEADGFTTAARAIVPVCDTLALTFKAGLFFWDWELSTSQGRATNDGVDWTYGGGLDFKLSSNATLGLEFTRYEVDSVDINNTALVGRLRF